MRGAGGCCWMKYSNKLLFTDIFNLLTIYFWRNYAHYSRELFFKILALMIKGMETSFDGAVHL